MVLVKIRSIACCGRLRPRCAPARTAHVLPHTRAILTIARLASLRLATAIERISLGTLLAAASLSFSAVASAEVQLRGADGVSLTLASPAKRVVNLSPDFSELLFDIGAGDTLVGTIEYSNYPEAAKQVPRIGDGFHVDVEKIVALKPDLVLVWQGGTPQALVDKLRGLKLPVLAMGAHDMTDIAANLETLGAATGHLSQAKQVADAFRTRLAALQARYAHAAPIRVFYEISPQPLYTVGGAQSISRLMAICGGHNIFADLSELAPVVGLEAVLARDPQAIVTGDGEGDVGERFKQWQQWPKLSAVRYGNLYAMNDDTISRATPRTLDAGELLCEDLDKARTNLTKK